jgi:hypothetical protein
LTEVQITVLGVLDLKVALVVKAFLEIVALIKAAIVQLNAIVVVNGTVTITAQLLAEVIAKIIIVSGLSLCDLV